LSFLGLIETGTQPLLTLFFIPHKLSSFVEAIQQHIDQMRTAQLRAQ